MARSFRPTDGRRKQQALIAASQTNMAERAAHVKMLIIDKLAVAGRESLLVQNLLAHS